MKILKEKLKEFSLGDVKILDRYETNAFSLEQKYLLSLDEERLLRGFCDIAGITSNAPLYGGWENSNIQGHTMGHYLTALSQAFAYTKSNAFEKKIDRILHVLGECQKKNKGYLAAIPETHYRIVESGSTDGVWVPWYTMHKILSGLISAFELAKKDIALEIASKLGDWVYSLTCHWTEETQKKVLNIEYGGMNDCLYRLYSHTKSEKHLSAAHSFDEIPLFEALYAKKNILDGKHANTTIPKLLGALRRYTVLGEGEEFYLQSAVNFWDIVVNGHTYITGGNSEWEHFGKSGILDAERTECNCETCNTYNMLKLTRELFMITGEKKYADYYENAFINAILSSQNSETGMTTYFQPMATGYFKVYSTPTEHFWCCTGSGMESFSKLGDSICFKDNDSIYVLRYTCCEILFKEKGITLTQKAELPYVSFTVKGNGKFTLKLRIPDWCSTTPSVKINGCAVAAKQENGFLLTERVWTDGDTLEAVFSCRVTAHPLPDNKNAVSFRYGPLLLSADMGKSKMNTGVTGVNVTVPLLDESINDKIKVQSESVEKWLRDLESNLVKEEESLIFRLKNTDRELVFTPHFRQHTNRYGIYFTLTLNK